MAIHKSVLMEVSEDCERLSLMDGSEWEVSPGDMSTACTWIPTAEIIVKPVHTGSGYDHELTNMTVRVSVKARRV